MIALNCSHSKRRKHGTTKEGTQRFRCSVCGKCFTESTDKLAGMRIGLDKAEQILRCLLEGNSVNSTMRLTDTNAHTIIDLLVLIGGRCQRFMKNYLRGIECKDIQADEIWNFVGCKQKTAERLKKGAEFGDFYCYTSIERETKLLVAWHLGKRSGEDTSTFCKGLAESTQGKFQLTTDGYAPYGWAVPVHLRARGVDFAQLTKIYGAPSQVEQRRYSPARITGIKKSRQMGTPDPKQICTSHVERSNLTIRMGIRRFTRLTNGFSKKCENHEAALGLFFAYYNFCRTHKTTKTSPAVAHGIAQHVWTVRELIERTVNS